MAGNTKKQIALRLLLCFGLAAVCFVVVLLTTGVRYRLNDDAAISNIAAGAYGPDTQYLVYVNVLFGWFLKPFYTLFPALNWFVVLQVVGALACFTYIGYVLLQKLGLGRGLCAYAFYLVLFGVEFLQQFHYVQYASLFLVVGFIVIAKNLGKINRATVIGTVLVLVGAMLRFQQFAAVGGLAAALLLWKFWKLPKPQKLRAAALVGCVVAVVFACKGIDTLAYMRAPGWAEYVRFNAARTEISDFRLQRASPEDLEELGYSEIDYDMLDTWNYYDPDVFSIENTERIAESLPKTNTLTHTVKETASWLIRLLYDSPSRMLFAAVLVGWFVTGKRKNWPVLLGTLAVLAVEIFYLQWLGRMPLSIVFSLVLAAVLLCGACYEEVKVERNMIAAVGTLLVLFCIPAFVSTFQAMNNDYWPSRNGRAAEFEEAVQDKDTLYLADTLLFDAANGYDVWHTRPKDFFSNVVFTGSWMMHSPPQELVLGNFGIENLYEDSTDRDDVIFLEIINADLKEKYMQQHYNPKVEMIRIEEGINLHKYSATTKPPEDGTA